MKHHPIAFVAQCVPGVLDGTKTQTRRVIKPQPVFRSPYWHLESKRPMTMPDDAAWRRAGRGPHIASRYRTNDEMCLHAVLSLLPCPYGVLSDALWVQETYQIARFDRRDPERRVWGKYLADEIGFHGVPLTDAEWKKLCARKHPFRPSPARFMYRSLSRTDLEILAVRVERVQDIVSDEYKLDVFHEGVCDVCEHCGTMYPDDPMEAPEVCGGRGGVGCFAEPGELFRQLWDSINARRGFDFASNPWVWALTFREAEEKPCKKRK